MPGSTETFKFYSLEYRFRARDAFHFPLYLAGNMFRGAFGSFLLSANPSAYKVLFATEGPPKTGLATPPRPFVLRCRGLSGRTFEPGQVFSLSLNVFLPEMTHVSAISAALDAMSEAGFGSNRSRASLLLPPEHNRYCLVLHRGSDEIRRLRVHFETPTTLKRSSEVLQSPTFADLFAAAHQRLNLLSSFYGTGPPQLGWKELRKAALTIEQTAASIRSVTLMRRSSRSGQRHPIGGFVGYADYAGDLTSFAPILGAASFTGIGSHTVWGNGELRLEQMGGDTALPVSGF